MKTIIYICKPHKPLNSLSLSFKLRYFHSVKKNHFHSNDNLQFKQSLSQKRWSIGIGVRSQ